jgi:hypothetical protein
MSASSELEPEPGRLRPRADLHEQPRLGVSKASREVGLIAPADRQGGFTTG